MLLYKTSFHSQESTCLSILNDLSVINKYYNDDISLKFVNKSLSFLCRCVTSNKNYITVFSWNNNNNDNNLYFTFKGIQQVLHGLYKSN